MNGTAAPEDVRTIVPEAVDFANAIRGDIRAVIRRLHKENKLFPGGPSQTLDVTQLGCVQAYLRHPKVHVSDTHGARVRHLRTQAHTYTFYETPQVYVGAALPDSGIPFRYTLEYEAPADEATDVCFVHITALP